jgi:hypothetical protein
MIPSFAPLPLTLPVIVTPFATFNCAAAALAPAKTIPLLPTEALALRFTMELSAKVKALIGCP